MKLEPGTLEALVRDLRGRVELGYKQDVQLAARAFGRETRSAFFPATSSIVNGDDAAALKDDAGGYVLLAAEGMRGEFVAADPWFAGFCSILANINDIAAMGGRPWAVVDVLFLGTGENERVLQGMNAASQAYGVPVVGGHTTRVPGASMVAAAVIGRAKRLISGSGAKPGQVILAAVSLQGSFRGSGGNFNAATAAPSHALRTQVALLADLAEAGLVAAGKDISMAGICGTLLMMAEQSGVGAQMNLALVPAPLGVNPLRWLTAFPSFGFLLTASADDEPAVCARFDAVGVACAPIGHIEDTSSVSISYEGECHVYWNLKDAPLTGFGP